MPNLQEITDAIDDRLVELRQQIASLQAARGALTGIQRSGPGGRTESRPAAATRTPPTARRSHTSAPRRPAASGSVSAAASTSAPPRSAAATAPKARAAKSSSRSRRRELEPGQIEGLLRESEDGLSLVALARRVGVSEANVSERLGSLERSGEVRRSGPRRTSLWRVVTDEERIAERAAELARASQSKT
jgi:DNA-binding MarR family transcriptional regulator